MDDPMDVDLSMVEHWPLTVATISDSFAEETRISVSSMDEADERFEEDGSDFVEVSTPYPVSAQNNVQESVGIVKITPLGSRYWLPDVQQKPFVGQTFLSLNHVYEFYQKYGKEGGFEIRKTTGVRGNMGVVTHKYYVCSREGMKRASKTDTMIVKKKHRKRPSCRIGCKASLRVKLNDERLYEVYEFVEEHNHSLVHKHDSLFLRSHRKLTYPQKQLLHDVGNINIGPCKAFKVLKQVSGGFDKVGSTSVECKNFKRDLNTFIGESDASMVVEKMMKKREYLSDFSFHYYKADDGTLGGLFWADQFAKRNYHAFGDVIAFDATFRTNKYNMIFVPFTGVDNHKRCVTFGAGFLSSETIEAYTWLLRAFKKTFNVEPKVVITDQDPAIKQALPDVFESARHRLCMWHITDKLTAKVGSNVCKSGFLKSINDILWNENILPEEFDTRWNAIIDEFDLSDNDWLSEMFRIRDRWVPAFFRDCPMSGLMRTTSRSEGENYFFGLLSNSNLHLVEFISNFDTAMEAQRMIQQKNDHDSRYTTPDLNLGLQIEKEASLIYTRNIFFDVQKELLASLMACHGLNCVDVDGTITSHVKDVDSDVRFHGQFQVIFERGSGLLQCSCKHFERYGLLCRHAFYMLRMCEVVEFPKHYINRRWTKFAVSSHSNPMHLNRVIGSEKKEEIQAMIRGIYLSVEYSIDLLVNDIEKLRAYRDKQVQLSSDVDVDMKFQPSMPNNEVLEMLLGVSQPDDLFIENPRGIRNKGCGSGKKRIKSGKELAVIKASKALRLCRSCGVKSDHDSRNCPHKN